MPAHTTIYQALADVRLIDPHSHIDPHSPASSTLADLLGYHYYTELAHSAGLPKSRIEDPDLGPKELVGRLIENLSPINNTAQYRWLVEMCRRFFDFDGDRVDTDNWEALYDAAEAKMSAADWSTSVLDQSGVDAVFLTNDFDDELTGFDADVYIPCLRTDDLVFHLGRDDVRGRLAKSTDIELTDLASLRDSLDARFQHFIASGARACAISLPPGFSPRPVSDGRAAKSLEAVLARGTDADPADRDALSRRVFWTLAERCDHYGLPFDLMIGVNRNVYVDGVHQGRDLYDSRVSLTQYSELFNRFPNVTFPVSVLASVTNQELVSHSWIFPNVITSGHWWYSNTPSIIGRDLAARIEAVPRNKQIGYYSDAYKLEFIWPKFDMYRHQLAKILGNHFVEDCGWSETDAIELGTQLLRGNVETIFPEPIREAATVIEDRETDAASSAESLGIVRTVAGVAGAAGAAAAMVDDEDGLVALETIVDRNDELDQLDAGDLTDGTGQPSGRADDPDPLKTLAGVDGFDEIPDLQSLPGLQGSSDSGGELSLEDTVPAGLGVGAAPNVWAHGDQNEDDADDDADDGIIDLDEELDPPLDDLELVSSSQFNLDQNTDESDGEDELLELDDDQPSLDVGDLTDATIGSTESIEMLRGDSGIVPDSESLKLKPDPTTGEWTFPADDDGRSGGEASSDGTSP